MIWASKKGIYTGQQYWPFLPLRPLDPSPFLPSSFQAAGQIKLLRDEFDSLNAKDHPETDYALAVAVLASVIFSGVDDPEVLKSLFLETCTCRRIPAIPDALLVRIVSTSYIVAMRGPAAVAYSRWRKMGGQPLGPGCIVNSLRHVFGKHSWAKTTSLLERLTNTQEIVNRIERSPISNLALNPNEGSTNFDSDQMDVLLGYAPEDTDLPPQEKWLAAANKNPEEDCKDAFLIRISHDVSFPVKWTVHK